MADPATEPDASSGRRHRRTERRRRRIRRVVAIVAGVVVLALLRRARHRLRALRRRRPTVAGRNRAAGRTGRHVVDGVDDCRRAPVPHALDRAIPCGSGSAATRSPGRSVPRSAPSPAPPASCSPTSTPACRAASPPPASSTGPTTPRPRSHASTPEIVVFIIGANDWAAVSGDAWKARLRRRQVDAMMKTLGAAVAPSTGWARRR